MNLRDDVSQTPFMIMFNIQHQFLQPDPKDLCLQFTVMGNHSCLGLVMIVKIDLVFVNHELHCPIVLLVIILV